MDLNDATEPCPMQPRPQVDAVERQIKAKGALVEEAKMEIAQLEVGKKGTFP